MLYSYSDVTQNTALHDTLLNGIKDLKMCEDFIDDEEDIIIEYNVFNENNNEQEKLSNGKNNQQFLEKKLSTLLSLWQASTLITFLLKRAKRERPEIIDKMEVSTEVYNVNISTYYFEMSILTIETEECKDNSQVV